MKIIKYFNCFLSGYYRVFFLLFISILLFQAIGMAKTIPSLRYELSMKKPFSHYFHVKMIVKDLVKDSFDVKMAAWTPGSYLIREFSKNVDSFYVSDGVKKIRHQKINKNTWRIYAKKGGNIIINYRVYAFEHSVRTSFLDASHAAIIPATVFMYVADYDLPSIVTIKPYPDWKVITTSLMRTGTSPWELYAPNFDILADSPIEIGNHTVLSLTAAGIPHYIGIYGTGNYDTTTIKNDIRKIADAATKIIGEHPCANYTFIINNVENNFGGLEHLSSTSLIYPRWDYHPEEKYTGFLALAAHEYFHLWNVKRIRPSVLGPFDYEQENYTRLLWVMEGFTTYYENIILLRAGLISEDKFLQRMMEKMNNVENTFGNRVQPVADASFDAWIKFYRSNENTGNCCISYYGKGAVMAMLLDLEILHLTEGQKKLDDVMRYLYTEYYKNKNSGFNDKQFIAAVEKIAGKDMDEFFEKYIYDAQQPDYARYFGYAGYTLFNSNKNTTEVQLGVGLNGNIITSVREHGAAWHAGLNVNDEIIAVDDFRVKDNVSFFLTGKKPGDKIEVLVSRGGILQSFEVVLLATDRVNYYLSALSDATELQQKILQRWLEK